MASSGFTIVTPAPVLSSILTYSGSIELPFGWAAPISAVCHAPVTLPVVERLENSAAVDVVALWLVRARPMRTPLAIETFTGAVKVTLVHVTPSAER